MEIEVRNEFQSYVLEHILLLHLGNLKRLLRSNEYVEKFSRQTRRQVSTAKVSNVQTDEDWNGRRGGREGGGNERAVARDRWTIENREVD